MLLYNEMSTNFHLREINKFVVKLRKTLLNEVSGLSQIMKLTIVKVEGNSFHLADTPALKTYLIIFCVAWGSATRWRGLTQGLMATIINLAF